MSRGVQDVGKETFRRLPKVYRVYYNEEWSSTAVDGPQSQLSGVKVIPLSSLCPRASSPSHCQVVWQSEDPVGIYRTCRRQYSNSKVFKEDLKEFRIPEDLIVDFSSVVFGNRTLGGSQPASYFRMHSSDTKKSATKYLGLQVESECGYIHKVPVAEFQELRYNVALILKEMNDLEKGAY
ncbi:hypothetical protein DUI87_02676 [Hirundo rustica rustica]|uniref:Uncharacterized protein n=1 Tax=Hirundo rustica rustica TaxID=333673 RepID=A0A3M0LS16_HIRRU|nr:hypothetical protein DUI87_02676 [Hirundo rustica rustica]